MRNTEKLRDKLRSAQISHTIYQLEGGAIGISHAEKYTGKVKNIAELMGYSFLLPYEYEYTYKAKPLGETIIF